MNLSRGEWQLVIEALRQSEMRALATVGDQRGLKRLRSVIAKVHRSPDFLAKVPLSLSEMQKH